MKRAIVVVAVLLMLLAGCARKRRRPAPIAPPPAPIARVGDVEEGVATWYGHPYHGRRASNGEIYDMDKLTAAHRTLPFGTIVRVVNLANDRSVDVRIIDRGPFVNGRIIDLSRAAARQIGMIGTGMARVRVTVTALPAAGVLSAGVYAVQIGAFRDRATAERLRREMERRHGTAILQLRDGDPPLWRVLVGRCATEAQAADLAAELKAETGAAFIVRLDAPAAD